MRSAALLGMSLALSVMTPVALAPVALVPVALAQDLHVGPVAAYVETYVRPWLSDPVIRDALERQNAASAALGPDGIAALDKTWRAEVESDAHPTIERFLDNPLSRFLRHKQDESEGAITEIFISDLTGLNAGASEVTSDLWQGDEEKFTRVMSHAGSDIFVEAAETDESTQMVQAHASLRVVDESGKTIGVITIGVNLDSL